MGRRHFNCLRIWMEGERSNWEGLSQGLSDYYNSPEKAGSVSTAICECSSPTWNGSGNVLPQNWKS